MSWGWESVNRDGYRNQRSRGGSPPKKGCGGKKKMFATLAILVIATGMQVGLAVQIVQTII